MSSENPTFHNINNHFADGHDAMPVLVERSGDKISTGVYKGEMKGDKYVVDVIASDGSDGYRVVSAEALSDQKQEAFAEELAGLPLRVDAAADTVPRSKLLVEAHEQSEALPSGVSKSVGHGALTHSGVEALSTEKEEQPKSEEDKLLEQLEALKEGLTDREKLALFQYVTALYPHEEASARAKMSLEMQANSQLLFDAKRIFGEIQAIRKRKN